MATGLIFVARRWIQTRLSSRSVILSVWNPVRGQTQSSELISSNWSLREEKSMEHENQIQQQPPVWKYKNTNGSSTCGETHQVHSRPRRPLSGKAGHTQALTSFLKMQEVTDVGTILTIFFKQHNPLNTHTRVDSCRTEHETMHLLFVLTSLKRQRVWRTNMEDD